MPVLCALSADGVVEQLAQPRRDGAGPAVADRAVVDFGDRREMGGRARHEELIADVEFGTVDRPFGHFDSKLVFRELDEWIRHRIRALHLKHWRRGPLIYRELRARGLSELAAARVAANARRWWKNSAMLGDNGALPEIK